MHGHVQGIDIYAGFSGDDARGGNAAQFFGKDGRQVVVTNFRD